MQRTAELNAGPSLRVMKVQGTFKFKSENSFSGKEWIGDHLTYKVVLQILMFNAKNSLNAYPDPVTLLEDSK